MVLARLLSVVSPNVRGVLCHTFPGEGDRVREEKIKVRNFLLAHRGIQDSQGNK